VQLRPGSLRGSPRPRLCCLPGDAGQRRGTPRLRATPSAPEAATQHAGTASGAVLLLRHNQSRPWHTLRNACGASWRSSAGSRHSPPFWRKTRLAAPNNAFHHGDRARLRHGNRVAQKMLLNIYALTQRQRLLLPLETSVAHTAWNRPSRRSRRRAQRSNPASSHPLKPSKQQTRSRHSARHPAREDGQAGDGQQKRQRKGEQARPWSRQSPQPAGRRGLLLSRATEPASAGCCLPLAPTPPHRWFLQGSPTHTSTRTRLAGPPHRDHAARSRALCGARLSGLPRVACSRRKLLPLLVLGAAQAGRKVRTG